MTGGQSGGDLAGNRFAIQRQIATLVNVCAEFWPKRAEDHQFFLSLSRYVVTPLSGIEGLRSRTLYNVVNADATIIFIQRPLNQTRGSRLTARFCEENHKNFLVIRLDPDYPKREARKVAKFLAKHDPEVLNVAGERTIFDAYEIDCLHRAWNELGQPIPKKKGA